MMDRTESEIELLELLKQRAVRRGTFLLASGGTSDIYIDTRMLAVFSRSTRLIGEVLYERTWDLDFDALGGLETGAIPLVTATVLTYDLYGRQKEGFWVRNQPKSHGTQKLVEGCLTKGNHVLLLEDVCTSGSSVLRAVQVVRELGCEVVGVLTLLDRLQGARELLAKNGVENFSSVFTVQDLLGETTC